MAPLMAFGVRFSNDAENTGHRKYFSVILLAVSVFYFKEIRILKIKKKTTYPQN